MAFKYGQMEPDTRENGRRIKLMVKENSGMLMEMYLMENGWMIKLMAMAFIHM
jgi:hypothetical protein